MSENPSVITVDEIPDSLKLQLVEYYTTVMNQAIDSCPDAKLPQAPVVALGALIEGIYVYIGSSQGIEYVDMRQVAIIFFQRFLERAIRTMENAFPSSMANSSLSFFKSIGNREMRGFLDFYFSSFRAMFPLEHETTQAAQESQPQPAP